MVSYLSVRRKRGKREKTMPWLITAIILSFLPIWRSGVHSRKEGVNFWQYMNDTDQEGYEPFRHPHIPFEEAVERAKETYQRCGLNRQREL